ncbi:porin [Selenihalanaerobacter shriftii]|uniref:Porin n=1 Tax=Selenihalanaerobacter shriftii TaxID=142842 RepID=A0A1T4JJA2_9FIRM|nr:porin [Selenihalanaerobacter shriftii]SJZ30255.1 porin [Selenihalanaerobacter shriftii]
MKKIAILLTLTLVVALAAPAMAGTIMTRTDMKVSGNLEIENKYNDPVTGDSTSQTVGDLEIYVEANPAENVTFYSVYEVIYEFEPKNTNSSSNIKEENLKEAWLKVDNMFGPLTLKAGRIEETATDEILYDEDQEEGVELIYDVGNVYAKLGHSIDSSDTENKALMFQGKLIDLGLVDAVALDYLDYNGKGDGYTLKIGKNHSFVDASIMLGEVDKDDDANMFDFRVSTEELLPGVTTSLEYADVEGGFINKGWQIDSVFADVHDDIDKDDLDMIRPGFNFDLSDKLNIDFSYAMFNNDDTDKDQDYLDLTFTYDLNKYTYLEVEYEDNDYDWQDNKEILTTTLGADF